MAVSQATRAADVGPLAASIPAACPGDHPGRRRVPPPRATRPGRVRASRRATSCSWGRWSPARRRTSSARAFARRPGRGPRRRPGRRRRGPPGRCAWTAPGRAPDRRRARARSSRRSTPARSRSSCPRWLEGFGLPPLEAAACGTPVDRLRPAGVPRDAGRRARCACAPGDEAALAEALCCAWRASPRRCAAGWPRPRRRGRGPLTWDGARRAPRTWLAEAGGAHELHRGRRPPRLRARPRRLLDSLEAHLPRRRPQLVVVDTRLERRGRAAGARDRGAEVIELAGNPGFGAANNAGVARAARRRHGPAQPRRRAARRRRCSRSPRSPRARDALLVPRLLNAGRQRRSAARTRVPGRPSALLPALVHPPLLPRGACAWRPSRGAPSAPRAVGWAIAAASPRRTATLRALGPFDPAAFLFYEDLDLCLRARAAGVPTCCTPTSAGPHGRPAPGPRSARRTSLRPAAGGR